MKSHIIGVTGVIGSGKSTVCRLLEQRGYQHINCDLITRELYKKGNAGYQKIIDYFGARFVNDGEVSRPKLRSLVLKNHQKLWILNTLMHPLIRQEVNKKIDQLKSLCLNKKEPLLVAVEAIFFEPRDRGTFVDELIRVDASDATITARIATTERELPFKHLATWLTYQRKNLWDIPVTLKNEGTVPELEVTLDKVLASPLQ